MVRAKSLQSYRQGRSVCHVVINETVFDTNTKYVFQGFIGCASLHTKVTAVKFRVRLFY